MGCRRYQKALNEAAAGGLTAERMRWLDLHLEKCPACAARLARRKEAMANVDAVLFGAAEVNPSQAFLARLQERLAEQAAVPQGRLLVRVTAIAALAGLALLGIWAAGSRRFYRPRPVPIVAHVSHRPVISELERSAAPAEANTSATVPAAQPSASSSASSGSAQSSAAAPAQGAAASSKESLEAEFPDGEGKQTFLTTCSKCHSPDYVIGKGQDANGWTDVVLRMIQNGAQGTNEEFGVIVYYLSQNVGPPPAKVNVNTATVLDFRNWLYLTGKQADAIVDYRNKHGDFKSIADLKKVPGIDPKMIDSDKSKLTFSPSKPAPSSKAPRSEGNGN